MKNYIYVLLISMVPLIELRGAIPVAYGIHEVHPEFSLLWAYIIIAIGNMIPVPFIYFFARKVLEWGKDKRYIGKFFTWCLQKGEKGGEKLQAKAGRGLYVALLLFVGIPLPGTGSSGSGSNGSRSCRPCGKLTFSLLDSGRFFAFRLDFSPRKCYIN